jgi:hypothetical protein
VEPSSLISSVIIKMLASQGEEGGLAEHSIESDPLKESLSCPEVKDDPSRPTDEDFLLLWVAASTDWKVGTPTDAERLLTKYRTT